jgi:hypothetical protein
MPSRRLIARGLFRVGDSLNTMGHVTLFRETICLNCANRFSALRQFGAESFFQIGGLSRGSGSTHLN